MCPSSFCGGLLHRERIRGPARFWQHNWTTTGAIAAGRYQSARQVCVASYSLGGLLGAAFRPRHLLQSSTSSISKQSMMIRMAFQHHGVLAGSQWAVGPFARSRQDACSGLKIRIFHSHDSTKSP